MEDDLVWCYSSGSGSGDNNNWDLHAVVGLACGGGSVSPPPPSDDPFASLPPPPPQPQSDELPDAHEWMLLPDLPVLDDLTAVDIADICQALFSAPQPPLPSSPRNEAPPQQPPADEPPAPEANPDPSGSSGAGSGPSRSKRKGKRILVERAVTRVPVGVPAPDLWAWRKYGQKPIKGSPNPRGYYRCSTDKECKARKQVERCRKDPSYLIVSYSGEHRHPIPLVRNSLAGTTRHKPPLQPLSTNTPAVAKAPQAPQQPAALAALSPTTPLRSPSAEFDEEEEDDALALMMLLKDAEMAPEDALLFPKPDNEPTWANGGGEDGLLFPLPNELTTGTSGGVGSRTDVGAETAPAPIINVVTETFYVSAWEAAPASSWDW